MTQTLTDTERLQLALDAGRMGTWTFNLRTGEQQWDQRQYELLGLPTGIKPTREIFVSLVLPEDLPNIEIGTGALATETYHNSAFRIRRPDGEVRWLTAHSVTRLGDDGQPLELVGVNSDVTERMAQQERLENSEAQLLLALEAARMGTWTYDLETGRQNWDARQYELFGLDPTAPADRSLFMSTVHPEDHLRVAFSEEDLRPGHYHDTEFRIVRPDGELRWITARSFAQHASDGRPVRRIGVNWDSTNEKLTEERLRLTVRELHHRTRNLLTIVQSIATQTAKRSSSVADFQQSFAGRIQALARVQDLVAPDTQLSVDLGELVALELEAANADGRASVSGPKVQLSGVQVQQLALGLHELATNARKHGALSTPGGELRVSWAMSIEGDHRLTISWVEQGLRAAPKRAGTGFGRLLLEKGLASSLNATTTFQLSDDELKWTIDMPMAKPLD